MRRITPQVGNWYRDIQQNSIFEVVAVDEIGQTIETQLLDGAVGEYDLENWRELLLEEVEEPEDWRDAYELSNEDYLDSDAAIHPEDWGGPLSMIESDIIHGIVDDM